LEYFSNTVRPFWSTSIEMPRFDSEYLAALAQLLGVISAEADEMETRRTTSRLVTRKNMINYVYPWFHDAQTAASVCRAR
jgi:hypothetical protein